MEFGDIIYFFLLVFFAILGFIVDVRKKKNEGKRLEKEPSVQPILDEYQTVDSEYKGTYYEYPESSYEYPDPPLVPPAYEFQSSLGQLSDSTKYDSFDNTRSSLRLSSNLSIPDSLYFPDSPEVPESPEIPVESHSRRTSDGKNRGDVHPLVAELHGEGAIDALRKGVIYSELFNRRY